MMKSALIKDLYSEIDRLKQGMYCASLSHTLSLMVENKSLMFFSPLLDIWFLKIIYTLLYTIEVYAAREKNGIYIPRDRYLNEEAEKKVSLDYFGFEEFFLLLLFTLLKLYL